MMKMKGQMNSFGRERAWQERPDEDPRGTKTKEKKEKAWVALVVAEEKEASVLFPHFEALELLTTLPSMTRKRKKRIEPPPLTMKRNETPGEGLLELYSHSYRAPLEMEREDHRTNHHPFL